MTHARRASFAVVIGSAALSGCLLRTPITNTFGYMPIDLADDRALPATWGWQGAALDTISRTDSAGGLLTWWGPSPVGAPTCGGVLLLHGKGKNRAEMLPLGRSLQAAGFSVLLPDYRGYGGTPGTPSVSGLHNDAALAYRDLRVRLGDSTLPVVVIGHSLGTALAARLAREQAPAATIYITPFTRMSALVRAKGGAAGPRLFDTAAFAFNPIEDAAQVNGRAMVVTAGRDLLIPRRVSDAFIAGLLQPPAVLRDAKASHNGVLSSVSTVRTITDSVRTWTQCSAASGL